jgi:hypothetical protein
MPRRTEDDFAADMKARRNATPGDAERKALIAKNAADALRRIKSGQTYEDYRQIGEHLMVITEETLDDLGLTAWDDPDMDEATKKQLHKEFTKRFEGWERSVSNAAPLTKQERWALRELMTNPAIHTWYMSPPPDGLTGPARRRLNHPNAIINRYKAKHPEQFPKTERAQREPSPRRDTADDHWRRVKDFVRGPDVDVDHQHAWGEQFLGMAKELGVTPSAAAPAKPLPKGKAAKQIAELEAQLKTARQQRDMPLPGGRRSGPRWPTAAPPETCSVRSARSLSIR